MKKSDFVKYEIKRMKEYMKANRKCVSWTFIIPKKDFNLIASVLSNNFVEYRVRKVKSEKMSIRYRNQISVKYWIELTISKNY